MLIDFQTEADLGPLEADLVIVGTGPAGLSIALQFLNTNKKVILLEGGGLEFSDESQAVYEGQNIGVPYFPLELARLRYFGGSAGHWGGWCRPLDPADFLPKPHVPHSGWPIGYDDISPFLEAAHDILDLGATNYDPAALPFPQELLPALDEEKYTLHSWRYSPPTRFDEKYLETFAQSDNAIVLYNANATNLTLNDDVKRALSVEIRNYGDKRHTVSGDYFVLAMGGIENSRFLLNCRDQIPAGIGNAHDNVGRYWMEHPQLTSATIVTGERRDLLIPSLDGGQDQDVEIRAGFAPAVAFRNRHEILNHEMTITPGARWYAAPGVRAVLRIRRDIMLGKLSRLDDHLRLLMSDLDGAVTGFGTKLGLISPTENVTAYARTEQSPNPDSRIVLYEAKDRFGQNRTALDWQITELDRRTFIVALEGLAEELGRLGIGRLQIDEMLLDDSLETLGAKMTGGNHHMGGTRMSDDPKTGVVDENCRVHGLDNLYIAGSSVFPTSGYATPTLTIVQLALRLADHLRSRMDHATE